VARFTSPQGIAVDLATWTVYVGDTLNHTIRRISADGVVSTLAGLAGNSGFAEGVGAAARFNNPRGLAIFGGIIYVVDANSVRAMTPGGLVSRVAGNGSPGWDDGVGSLALFQTAAGVGVDAAGTLYVSDFVNNTIRMGEVLMALSGDVDGDGFSDFALFGPNSGHWMGKLSSGPSDGGFTLWGRGGDLPVPGDYDADGFTDLGVYHPSDNTWHIAMNIFAVATELHVAWGTRGDLPVPADYDGDGKTDIAVYRPSTGQWFIIQSSTSTVLQLAWGTPGDLPVPADFDGDGKADIAVYRPSTFQWFIIQSSTSTPLLLAWGSPGDLPVPADYDGDGKADIAVYRPSTGQWFIIQSTTFTLLQVAWGGVPAMFPLPADHDGDGTADITVYDASTSTWYIIQSSSSTARVVTYP
jgi:hypothetical protein